MEVSLPLLLPSILVTISIRLQQGACWIFNGHLIQRSYFPLHCLKHPDRRGAPNANHWHASPNLPPQLKPILTERVISCHSSSSTMFVLKLFQKMPLQPAPSMPTISPKPSSSSDLVVHGEHLTISSHQKTPLVEANLQDMVMHHSIDVSHAPTEARATSWRGRCIEKTKKFPTEQAE